MAKFFCDPPSETELPGFIGSRKILTSDCLGREFKLFASGSTMKVKLHSCSGCARLCATEFHLLKYVLLDTLVLMAPKQFACFCIFFPNLCSSGENISQNVQGYLTALNTLGTYISISTLRGLSKRYWNLKSYSGESNI